MMHYLPHWLAKKRIAGILTIALMFGSTLVDARQQTCSCGFTDGAHEYEYAYVVNGGCCTGETGAGAAFVTHRVDNKPYEQGYTSANFAQSQCYGRMY